MAETPLGADRMTHDKMGVDLMGATLMGGSLVGSALLGAALMGATSPSRDLSHDGGARQPMQAGYRLALAVDNE